MDSSLNEMMAKLALAGVECHCHDESLLIASWLEQAAKQAEAACLIRVCSLMGQGRCAEALLLDKENAWESLSPWLALCERNLGLGAALDRRLDQLEKSQQPSLVGFARGMRISGES